MFEKNPKCTEGLPLGKVLPVNLTASICVNRVDTLDCTTILSSLIINGATSDRNQSISRHEY